MNYFSRATLNVGHIKAEKLAGLACSDGYREHQALWRLFPDDPDADRDFLFRRDELYRGLRYFIVSRRVPEDADGLWVIETTQYAPSISDGQRLAFSLRANPVVKRTGEDGRPRRHDVVMDAKQRAGYQSLGREERESAIEIAQRAGVEWLQKRAARHGFSIEKEGVRVEGYRQHRSAKRKDQITYSSLDFAGVLQVEDARLFAEALTAGIGPAKAFGCGLMMVRRV